MAVPTSLGKITEELLGLRISPQQGEAFRWYASELIAWNKRFNLTAITDRAEIETKHFLDSLTCLSVMGAAPQGKVLDVGSGAGFPGIPLKIVHPQLRLTLLESIGKKVAFCRHVVAGLGLEGVEVIQDRAETAGHMAGHRQAYDWVVARAVAALPVLIEYVLPFLKLGCYAIAQKGETGPAEVQAAESALQVLGGRIEQVESVELPRVAETRYLIVIRKSAATPVKYPRRAGIPAKRPLGS